MKILFLRHGEAQDDIENRYGGWGDFPLTAKGAEEIKDRITSIKNLNISFEKVFTSPLLRARSTAKIISDSLNLPLEVFEYAKEQNKYGVLTGLEKSEANMKYPDQVLLLDKGEYVDGSERYEDLTGRVRKCLSLLEIKGIESCIVVTHGNFLSCLFNEFIGAKITKKEDGGWVLVDLKNGNVGPEQSLGIEFESTIK